MGLGLGLGLGFSFGFGFGFGFGLGFGLGLGDGPLAVGKSMAREMSKVRRGCSSSPASVPREKKPQ